MEAVALEENILTTQPAQTRKKRPAFNVKTQKALEIIEKTGCDVKTAYLVTHGKPPTPSAESRFKDKVLKHSIQTPQMQKLAANVVRDCMKGKEQTYTVQKAVAGVGIVDMEEKIIPTWTNKLAAAAMVQDRVDPAIRRQENLNVNVEMHPVDLEKYLG